METSLIRVIHRHGELSLPSLSDYDLSHSVVVTTMAGVLRPLRLELEGDIKNTMVPVVMIGPTSGKYTRC